MKQSLINAIRTGEEKKALRLISRITSYGTYTENCKAGNL